MRLTPPFKPKQVVLAVLAAGALLSCFALASYFQVRESARWPQAEGTITTSHVETGYSQRFKRPFYYGVVEYDYWIAAERFHGTRISFEQVHPGPEQGWQRVVDSYPVGTQVKVYYNPENPGVAVLRPGLYGEMHDLFVLCIILTAIFSASFLVLLFAESKAGPKS